MSVATEVGKHENAVHDDEADEAAKEATSALTSVATGAGGATTPTAVERPAVVVGAAVVGVGAVAA